MDQRINEKMKKRSLETNILKYLRYVLKDQKIWYHKIEFLKK